MAKVPRFALGFVIILIALAMYFNAPILFGEYTEAARLTLQVYLLLYAVVLATIGRGLPSLNLDIFALRNFALMFLLTVLIMTPVAMFISPEASLGAVSVIATGFGALHFVKVFIEETIWAEQIKKYFGVMFSVVTFGIFHFAVNYYSGSINFYAILLLMGLRFVWDYIYARWGLFGSVGSHFGYNAIIAGFRVI